jgi:aldose sugar dehydrogenase
VNPWAIAFLLDARMLVTERPGRMRIVTRDGKLSPPLSGVPQVFASGQGGLLDVALDRGYAQNQTIYFCYAEPVDGGARTALARAKLDLGETPGLSDVKVIFRQEGPLSHSNHHGCRIVQTADNNLFLTLGEHFTYRDQAQNLGNHLGKIVRIRPDGSVPPDNPFVNRAGAKPEIWSYGHRNSQGAALNPARGKLWTHEHGPRGGDEINIPEAGKNYGWPVIGYGIDYSGARIHEATSKPGMEQPIKYWVPSIAPSGMAFYDGKLIPAWKGNLFVGALAGQMLVRLELDGEKVVKEERLLEGLHERIRDVREGPDGALYLATDSRQGRILRLAPAK